MNDTAKVLLRIAGVCVLAAVVFFGVILATNSEALESKENFRAFMSEGGTSGILKKGTFDAGYTFDEPITDLNLRFAYGNIELVQGDICNIDITGMYENGFECEVRKGTLYVTDVLTKDKASFSLDGNLIYTKDYGYAPKIVITLPAEVYNNCEILVGGGRMTAESLSTEVLTLQIGAGEVDFDKLTVKQNGSISIGAGDLDIRDFKGADITLECGVGDAGIQGVMTGKCSVDCGIGNIEIDLYGDASDYGYSVERGIGTVSIDGKKVSSSETVYNSEADNFIDIECGIGEITIDFE